MWLSNAFRPIVWEKKYHNWWYLSSDIPQFSNILSNVIKVFFVKDDKCDQVILHKLHVHCCSQVLFYWSLTSPKIHFTSWKLCHDLQSLSLCFIIHSPQAGSVTGTLYELFQVVFRLRQEAGLTKKVPNNASQVSNGKFFVFLSFTFYID